MIIDYAKTLLISDEESSKWSARIQRINNKLSDKYYSSCEDKTIIVGSVGRQTAIAKTSDYDILFVLPSEVYTKFNNYEHNGQSSLLQEVKDTVKESYPNTEIKADGQVVDIVFNDGIIELVPAFKQDNGSYKYPDSNNGGSWKYTKPIQEIQETISAKEKSDSMYNYLCFLMRRWKNYTGFVFKGLLIDTMVFNYINSIDNYNQITEDELLSGLYTHLSKEDRDKTYWLALGSNQQISNDDNGKFIYKASQALKKFKDDISIESMMKELFGYKQYENRALSEAFIEEMFQMDIRYNMTIDCEVTQEGFLTKKLSDYLNNYIKLKNNKTLKFFIARTNVPNNPQIDYYWKVRNLGPESKDRERGQIIKGSKSQIEHSNFSGSHYVECFAVLENTVIARSRIDVPIDVFYGQ